MRCKYQENLKDCPCSYPNCLRKGVCCQCLQYHKKRGELPACYFSKEEEKSYDRSIKNFIKNFKNH